MLTISNQSVEISREEHDFGVLIEYWGLREKLKETPFNF